MGSQSWEELVERSGKAEKSLSKTELMNHFVLRTYDLRLSDFERKHR